MNLYMNDLVRQKAAYTIWAVIAAHWKIEHRNSQRHNTLALMYAHIHTMNFDLLRV